MKKSLTLLAMLAAFSFTSTAALADNGGFGPESTGADNEAALAKGQVKKQSKSASKPASKKASKTASAVAK